MDTLLVSRDDAGVVTLTLNRPERKNAFTQQSWHELIAVLDEVAVSRDDRVVVITGAGDAFTSGADLGPRDEGERIADGAGTALRLMRTVGRCALRLHELPQPTIAAVNGAAVGAGCNLALGCDLIIAADTARFIEIFPKRGLSLDNGGSWLLPRLIGLHKAKEIAYLGDPVSGEEAARIGLVNAVVPEAELMEHVTALARRLAAQPPMQLSVIKKQLNHSASMTLAEAVEWEDVAQALAFGSADAKEALQAFVQKREPRFTGR
ncbi:MAG: enoyl-CoA hydratase [Actinobacteria bacterium]|nr:MAG: enoyl-CoA hydratase [Actinomycetota bacterium]